jgi:hypothetical protein
MSKEQEDLLGEVYKNYLDNFVEPKCPETYDVQPNYYLPMSRLWFEKSIFDDHYRSVGKNGITNQFGITVETRELTWEERRDIAKKTMDKREFDGYFDEEKGYWVGFGHISPFTDFFIHYWLNSENIPTKLITITYNDKTIESYE